MRKRHGDSIVLRTYKTSITEGIFAQVYGNLSQIGSGFITKMLVIMGATPLQYSLLSAIGQVSAVWQPLGMLLSRQFTNYRQPCIRITAIGRFLTLFLGLALLFPTSQQGIWYMLSLLFVSAGFQAMGANIWIAWISDLIPLKIRGRFFSRRNQILFLVGLLASYIVSFHVDLFEARGGGLRTWYLERIGGQGFFIPEFQTWFLAGLFVLAAVIGLVGLVMLGFQPERHRSQTSIPGWRQSLSEPFQDKNFRLLIVFGMWWMLAIGIGSPFWGPFMLKKLQMGLFEMQIYSSLHIFASLLSFNFWGKFIDRFGNKTAMKICVFLGGLNPMFWLFMSASNHIILWFEALLSGFMWAGAGIVTTNFVLSIAPKRKEQAYSGVFAAVTGVSMMITTLASGVFYPGSLDIGIRVLEPEQVIFGIGGLMRWLAIFPLALVREYRSVPLRKALAYTLQRIFSWRLRPEK